MALIVLQLHQGLGNAIVFFMLICSAWGFVNYLRGQAVGPNLRGSLVIGEGLILVQGALGVGLLILGLRSGSTIHLLYGILAAVALPAAYMLLPNPGPNRRESLQIAVVCLFIVGLALRAMTTA